MWRISILFESSRTENPKILRKSEKLHILKIQKKISFSLSNSYFFRTQQDSRRFSSILRKLKELQNWEILVDSHICLLDKINNTNISTDKTYFKN